MPSSINKAANSESLVKLSGDQNTWPKATAARGRISQKWKIHQAKPILHCIRFDLSSILSYQCER